MTRIRVWLSHDGYRDPDDNLAQLVGAAKARTVAKANPDVKIAGVIFGDTTDGGQYHMLRPLQETPYYIDDGDARFDDQAKNKIAAGNYAFFKNYGAPAIKQMAPGWEVIDTIKDEAYGVWKYDASEIAAVSNASRALVADILDAISTGSGGDREVVVYSAGGGAHVPAEAIAYLRNKGWSEETLKLHFAIIQHGRSNFEVNLEPAAQQITRAYTIPISKQDLDEYANGMSGPGLGSLARGGIYLDGSRFGSKMAEALDVAQGLKAFQGLAPNQTFKPTTDGSDAGSHAFAVGEYILMANWNKRLQPGETLPNDVGREHEIGTADGGYRLRVIYEEFDWQDARMLMNGASAADLADAGPEAAAAADASAAGRAASKQDGLRGKAGDALALGDADVFAFTSDGSAAVPANKGRVGAAEHGKDHEVERAAGMSEKLLVELGEESDAVGIIVAGLSRRGDAYEAAEVTAHRGDGTQVETILVSENGRTDLAFDDDVRYLTIVAAEWQGEGLHPSGHPDFSLVWVEAL